MMTLTELSKLSGRQLELFRDAAGQLFGRTTGCFTPPQYVEMRKLIRTWDKAKHREYLRSLPDDVD